MLLHWHRPRRPQFNTTDNLRPVANSRLVQPERLHPMNTPKLLASAITLLALVYSRIETHHFGNNFFPQSDAEVIADGIVVIVLAIGLAVHAFASSRVG